MAEIHKLTSRYKQTPVTNFYLDIWENVSIAENVEDTLIELDAKYHERPDLLAYDLYGSPRLWWVFARRNMNELVDPIGDFKSGILIYTPAQSTIDRITG